MSTCERCGATFYCAMSDGNAGGAAGSGDGTPCWCTLLPPAVPVPRQDTPATPGTRAEAGVKAGTVAGTGAGCWCPDCLKAHIAGLQRQRA